MNKVAIFAVYNDTDKYAVLVDRYYGLFDTQAEAEACHAQASEQFEYYHGALNILPPNQAPAHNIFGEPYAPISETTPIDIAGYVQKRVARAEKKRAGYGDILAKNNLPARFVAPWPSKMGTGNPFNFDDFLNAKLETAEDIWRRTVHGVDYSSYCYDN